MEPAYQDDSIQVYQGDCRTVLAELPAASVQTVVTSPPFFHLRDYGVDGQIGLEPTLPAYIAEMVGVFAAARRVLRDDGTCWIEIGDCYSGGRGGGGKGDEHGQQRKMPVTDLGPKQLMGVPWRLAFALQDDGWILRQEIVWHKPNVLPESVQDRPTRAHSTVFLLSKQARYFYDALAIKEAQSESTLERFGEGQAPRKVNAPKHGQPPALIKPDAVTGSVGILPAGRNRRSVWTIPTSPYGEAHFACFPPALVEPCILAGTSARGACPTCGKPWERIIEKQTPDRCTDGWSLEAHTIAGGGHNTGRPNGHVYAKLPAAQTIGWRPGCDCRGDFDEAPEYVPEPVPCVVLDPFFGSGTVAAVAVKHNRRAIGIELNPDYVAMSVRRFGKTQRTLAL